jgi:hypothetical protein
MIERNFVTRETLAAIEDVNRRCHELHVPAPPVVFVTTELFERDGSPVLRQHEQARSWTRNFYNLLASSFLPCGAVDPGSVGFGAGSIRMKSTAGTVMGKATNYPNAIQPYAISTSMIGGDSENFGLFVGTGTGPFNFEGHALTSKIEKGTGAGQMQWVREQDNLPTYDPGEKKWIHSWQRDFANNSGAAIIVGETGLYYYLYYGSSGTSRTYFMVEHNVLAAPVEVADGQTLRVTYTTEMTFPA